MHIRMLPGRRRRAIVATAVLVLILIVAAGAATSQTTQTQPMRVTMDQLDDRPDSFLNRQIVVDAEVEQVLGPRLFTIDEYEWFDFDGDTLVFIPAPLAGLVSERARVTVTGTVRPFVRTEIEREWGVFDLDPQIEIEFKRRPVLVATSVKSDRGLEMTFRVTPDPSGSSGTVVGTTGTAGGPALTNLMQLAATMDLRLVGRQVNLTNARVSAAAEDNSVWVSTGQGQDRLLVVPAQPGIKLPGVGQTVNIQGVVLQMPDAIINRAREQKQPGADEEIYVLATRVDASSR